MKSDRNWPADAAATPPARSPAPTQGKPYLYLAYSRDDDAPPPAAGVTSKARRKPALQAGASPVATGQPPLAAVALLLVSLAAFIGVVLMG